jgi:hypothetical protein
MHFWESNALQVLQDSVLIDAFSNTAVEEESGGD